MSPVYFSLYFCTRYVKKGIKQLNGCTIVRLFTKRMRCALHTLHGSARAMCKRSHRCMYNFFFLQIVIMTSEMQFLYNAMNQAWKMTEKLMLGSQVCL